ncbi:uncharacterized protein LOC134235540 [Saccostrea cucullata]|uniref:uncharacterized protein LOC134235540 n=1 Tax=Saccostrea cuccullata TaxID=36930 RepID=UPI002ED2D65F
MLSNSGFNIKFIVDETSWKIGCSVSVALNMIFISSIVVYIIIKRKKEIFMFKKNIHDPGKNCEEANVGSTNMNTITDKPFYEELDALEKSSEYQELQVESKSAYENLAFETA